jgi:outer membrane immunogenic protein
MGRIWISSVTAVIACGSAAAPACAQEAAFTGAHAGLEAGVLEHHYGIIVEEDGIVVRDEYQRSWGVGGGIFAGYDMEVSPRIRVGTEASLVAGGETNTARIVQNGTELSLSPRWGYRLTGRAGLLVQSNLLVYALGGFGGHRYELRSNSAGVENPPVDGDSFIIGGGIEYRASRRMSLRFDFKHLDNQTNQFFIGIPVRF